MVFVPEENFARHARLRRASCLGRAGHGSVRSVVELPMNNFGRPKIQTTHQGPVLCWPGSRSTQGHHVSNRGHVWGVLMDNQIRSIPVSLALDPMIPVHQMGRVVYMGDETGPGGDPGTFGAPERAL